MPVRKSASATSATPWSGCPSHPVLVELCGSGTFRAGGHTHEYIVLEAAEGVVVEEEVLELAKEDRQLPELEAWSLSTVC